MVTLIALPSESAVISNAAYETLDRVDSCNKLLYNYIEQSMNEAYFYREHGGCQKN